MPKKLHQVDWSKGQVDGDNLPGMVKEILNMELDRPGALYTRASLDMTGVPVSNAHGHARIETNVTGDPTYADYVWDVYFRDTFIQLIGTPVGGSSDPNVYKTSSYPFDVADLDATRCETITYGEKVFFCAVDTSDVPLGVCIVSFTPPGSRFRAGPGISDSPYDVSAFRQSHDWDWRVRSLNRVKPVVSSEVARSFKLLANNDLADLWFVACEGADVHDSLFEAESALKQRIGVGECGLLLTAMPEADGLYGSSAIVDFHIQYKYLDGSYSGMSDSCRISVSTVASQEEGDIFPNDHVSSSDFFEISGHETLKYGVGVGLFLDKEFDINVDEVRIFKKVLTYDNADLEETSDYDLVHIAKIKDDEDAPVEEYTAGEIAGVDRYKWLDDEVIEHDSTDYTFLLNYCSRTKPARRSGAVVIELDNTLWHGSSRRGGLTFENGEVEGGSGWSENSHLLHYIPECFGVKSAEMVMDWDNLNTDAFGDVVLRTTDVYALAESHKNDAPETRVALGSQLPVYIATRNSDGTTEGVSGHSMLQPFRINLDEVYTAAIKRDGSMFTNQGICLLDVQSDNTTFTYSYGGGSTLTDSLLFDSVARDPIVFIMDMGRAGLYTDESFSGVDQSDFVQVRPRHIAVIGGRLFCLNGFFDGIDEETRLFYSSHGDHTAFSKYAYIDYGKRNDGIGVSMSTHKNKLILHFSGATYILDISGGIDSSWRELGAVAGVGTITPHATTETPVGVFWYNGLDVVWFDGREIITVSNLVRQRRSVRETLAEMVGDRHTDVRLMYRKSIRQAWVCVDNNVLVLDIDTLAWHKHELGDEVNGYLRSIEGSADDEVLVTTSANYQFVNTSIVEFTWGIKTVVDIGVPEIDKKAKRIYVDVRPDDDTSQHLFEMIITGNSLPQTHQMLTEIGGGVIRLQASIRGRHIELDIHSKEGSELWATEIESLGMSYKPKRVK